MSEKNGLANRKARTRTALITAAQGFIADGNLGVPVLEITQAAEVANGSFYNHFDSKDALLLTLAARIGEDADTVVATQDPAVRAQHTMRPHLEVFWEIFERNRTVIDALRDAALVSSEFASRMNEFTAVQFEPWVDRLRAFEGDGVALPASPETTAQLIGGTAESFARNWTGDSLKGLESLVRFVDRSIFGA